MDQEQKIRIKRQAAEMLIDIYDLMLDKIKADDSDTRMELNGKIRDLQEKRENLLKRIR